MATVKELKATVRPKSGKGAARAERRAGKVPAVIYGENKPPVTVSLDFHELRQRIYGGRFTTTLYDIEIEGQKHRVIPRDFQLDPVKEKKPPPPPLSAPGERGERNECRTDREP